MAQILVRAGLCVRWGCYFPSNDQIEISKAEYYTAADFAKAVLEAEGMDAAKVPGHEE